jgi:hypothetical protein
VFGNLDSFVIHFLLFIFIINKICNALVLLLLDQVNEHYLFHGFRADCKDSIVRTGLDNRLGEKEGLLGAGIYTAERSTKSDAYTGKGDDEDDAD